MVADQFHQLPSVVARDLDDDPERLSLAVIPLLRYARAKAEFDAAKEDSDLDHWKGSKVMAAVRRNAFDIHHARVHPGDLDEKCGVCARNRARKEAPNG